VLAIVHAEDEPALDLALKVKAIRSELPVAVLATDPSFLTRLEGRGNPEGVDRIFLWQNDPMAGLYATYMLPNSDAALDERLGSLLAAIKLVWASTFGDNPRSYFRQTSDRLEDERMAHGNGSYRGIRDLVCVKMEAFETSKTREIAREIGAMNKILVDQERPYVLVGFGRWGSTDPWMGIGVGWAQISGVKVLVEVGLKGFNAAPAQGTHFFQNVTSLNIGCLSVPYGSEAFIRWEQLQAAECPRETTHLKLLRWPRPLEIGIDGRKGEAVIVLPASV
jgi:hypothetical protein